LGAYVSATLSTSVFASAQLPRLLANPFTPTTRLLALQLGNVYGLLALIGVAILYTTAEPKVVRNFLIACAIGDVGHLAVTCHVMGHREFLDLRDWNYMAWGSIGVTTALFVTRVGYLMGWFGEDHLGRRGKL
jgi:hypothetical protein